MSFRALRDQQEKGKQNRGNSRADAAKPAYNSAAPSTSSSSAPSSSFPDASSSPAASTTSTATAVPSSRLCVKNLPVHVKEDRLRTIFGAKGEVTDVKLLKTADGRSRKMAFIGYRNLEDSTAALAHFNKTFIDTSKIDVEYAVNPREAKEALRPWSRYSEGSSRHPDSVREREAQMQKVQEAKEAKEKNGKLDTLGASIKKSSAFTQSALFGLRDNKQLAKLLTDPKFKEYLHVMGSRSKNKFWSNTTMEDLDTGKATHTAAELASLQGEKSYQTYEQYLAETNGGKLSDGDDDDDYFNAPMLDRDVDEDGDKKTAPTTTTAKTDAKKSKKEPAEEKVTINPVALSEKVSDLDYLKSKQGGKDFDDDSDMEDAAPADSSSSSQNLKKRKAVEAGDEEDATKEDEEGEGEAVDEDLKRAYEADAAAAEAAASSAREKQDLLDTGRLFLRNLSYTVTEKELRTLFEPYGSLSEVYVPLDAEKKPKGFAYISYNFPPHALAAQRTLDGHFFLGRLLHILNAHPKPIQKNEWEKFQALSDAEKNKISYKKKKELEMQAHAGSKKDQASWNALFIRSDTVTDSIASKYGLSKSQIMDTSASSGNNGEDSTNLAVRLALAETQLINETKNFLKEHGVDVKVFDQSKAATLRSDTAILIKNIPFNTELDELRRLFAAFGNIQHIVMPPSRTMAMIEFQHTSDAKKAFKNLAYKKFKYVPLYLEWAPDGAFAAGTAAGGAVEGKKKVTDLIDGGKDAEDEDGNAASSSGESATLYVKNLNFATTEESLKKLFSTVGVVRSCIINMKKNTKARPHTDDPAFLSMGYGFVEYRSAADAKKALTQMQGVQLDNHALEVKLSSRGTSTTTAPTTAKPRTAAAAAHAASAPDAAGVPSTKLLVKNVPFETTARELRDLFSAFGSIQRIRLPKKFGQLGHRGFAFIDFVTKSEAKNALENVKHSHLYGRHLVIEYAAPTVDQDSTDVEALRKKTQQQYEAHAAGAPPHKKRRVEQDDDMDESFEKQFK